jgi:diguanylate cyclase (GGDEF)-like protein
MAGSFNAMQIAIGEAAGSLDGAREGLRAANVELERLAFNDPLTALANRTLFKRHLDLAVERRRRDDRGVAVMFIDLDDFKLVNDSFGHSAGDELLRQAADRLRAVTRRSDVVARQGGDEFLCLIDDVDAEGAELIARKVVEALSPPFVVANAEVYVSASVGVSVFPLDADSSEELLKHADIAMYTAKHAGRNNAQLYARTSDSALEQVSLTSSLHRALERDELVLHYQPIFDLVIGLMLKTEALVRWIHPERGLVLPEEFISTAERNGLIAPISHWVAR